MREESLEWISVQDLVRIRERRQGARGLEEKTAAEERRRRSCGFVQWLGARGRVCLVSNVVAEYAEGGTFVKHLGEQGSPSG